MIFVPWVVYLCDMVTLDVKNNSKTLLFHCPNMLDLWLFDPKNDKDHLHYMISPSMRHSDSKKDNTLEPENHFPIYYHFITQLVHLMLLPRNQSRGNIKWIDDLIPVYVYDYMPSPNFVASVIMISTSSRIVLIIGVDILQATRVLCEYTLQAKERVVSINLHNTISRILNIKKHTFYLYEPQCMQMKK
jgi:hypothetical protein